MELELGRDWGREDKIRLDSTCSLACFSHIWKSHKQIAGCADRSHPDRSREQRPDQGRLVQIRRFLGFALSNCLAGDFLAFFSWLSWGESKGRQGQSSKADLFHSLCVISELLNAFDPRPLRGVSRRHRVCVCATRRMIYVATICLQLVLMMFFSSTHTQILVYVYVLVLVLLFIYSCLSVLANLCSDK